jgi:hypothetical protein
MIASTVIAAIITVLLIIARFIVVADQKTWQIMETAAVGAKHLPIDPPVSCCPKLPCRATGCSFRAKKRRFVQAFHAAANLASRSR